MPHSPPPPPPPKIPYQFPWTLFQKHGLPKSSPGWHPNTLNRKQNPASPSFRLMTALTAPVQSAFSNAVKLPISNRPAPQLPPTRTSAGWKTMQLLAEMKMRGSSLVSPVGSRQTTSSSSKEVIQGLDQRFSIRGPLGGLLDGRARAAVPRARRIRGKVCIFDRQSLGS